VNKQRSYVDRGLAYARDVISGKILACKWVMAACQRQIDDLARWKVKGSPYQWKPAKANEVCAFIELLPHVKGEWAKRGETIRLEDWRCFSLTTIFGWYRADGTRRFRTVYNEEPRKQGKSTTSAGVGLYMGFGDGEAGANVYSAATTRDQTKPVFQECAQEMVKKLPDFREAFGVEVTAHNISCATTASKFEALSADASTLDGLNVHCAIVDELHAHPTRKVWDVLETATGSRSQPLIWAITTAGSDKTGICYEQRTYVTKILERVIEDETYFGIIYTCDEGDDPFDPKTWAKANPNLGVSVKLDDLERKAHKAAQLPSALSNFLTKHLNVWVSADAGLYDMLAWERARDSSLKIEDFAGCECWLGLDLAFVSDLSALVLLFRKDDKFTAFAKCYLPEEKIDESGNSQYSGWKRSGHLEATDGNVTDINAIIDDIEIARREYDVRAIAYDPYGEAILFNGLAARGIGSDGYVPIQQRVDPISKYTSALMKAIKSEQIAHSGNPVLTWGLSNVVGHMDKNDNPYPTKERPENKIDPAIALTMAYGWAMSSPDVGDFYKDGLMVV
jgi:phage terminase large subunit-like protein